MTTNYIPDDLDLLMIRFIAEDIGMAEELEQVLEEQQTETSKQAS